MKTISVLIRRHAGPTGGVLLCRNGSGAWELPHDRVRTNETDEDAVRRVVGERLGMTVAPGQLLVIGRHYPKDGWVEHLAEGNITHNTHTKFDFHCYYEAVDTWQTEPRDGAYDEYRWVHPSELGQYEFAGDDADFAAKYEPWVNARPIPDVRMYGGGARA